MGESKLQVAIYRIESKYNLAGVITLLKRDKDYTEQSLTHASLDSYSLQLFYNRHPTNPKWKQFLAKVADAAEPVVTANQASVEGFVLLLHKGSGHSVYAMCGGTGYFAIQSLVDMNFGMDVFSRLVAKEEKILRSTREQSVVGGVQGITKHFRTQFNLIENDSFGKIYQEVIATLGRKALMERLGLPAGFSKKGAICVAKSCFKVRKAITFEQVVSIINGCEVTIATCNSIVINNVAKLTKKKDQHLISQLKVALLKQLWTRYSTPMTGYQFDLCHRDFDKYLTASKYIVRKGSAKVRNFFKDTEFEELRTPDVIFALLKASDAKPADEHDFTTLVEKLTISSYDDDDIQLTDGAFLAHVFGDVPLNGQRYFLIDGVWYEIAQDFIDRLNEQCKFFIKDREYKGLSKKWSTTKSENEYVQEYVGDANTIVLDRVLADNIEVCDLIKWDDGNMYLYHLKLGVDNSMRDLCSQVLISASRVIHGDVGELAGRLYDSLAAKIGGRDYFDVVGKQTHGIARHEFIKLFSDRRLHLVLAVRDRSKGRSIKDIEEFGSSIAKFSICELVRGMKAIDADLLIEQLDV